MSSDRVQALFEKLERHIDEPDLVKFFDEIEDFSYEELLEVADRLEISSGLAPDSKNIAKSFLL